VQRRAIGDKLQRQLGLAIGGLQGFSGADAA
jgi:hypothetical protein